MLRRCVLLSKGEIQSKKIRVDFSLEDMSGLNGPVDEKCKLQINEDVQIAKEKIEEAIKLITKQMPSIMKSI